MASRLKRGQHGDGKIGLIIALLLVGSVGYLIMKWVPVRTQNAEFTDYIERAAQRFAINEFVLSPDGKAIVVAATPSDYRDGTSETGPPISCAR